MRIPMRAALNRAEHDLADLARWVAEFEAATSKLKKSLGGQRGSEEADADV